MVSSWTWGNRTQGEAGLQQFITYTKKWKISLLLYRNVGGFFERVVDDLDNIISLGAEITAPY